MHRGLPVEVSMDSVNWGSSESEFGISVNSASWLGLQKKNPRLAPGWARKFRQLAGWLLYEMQYLEMISEVLEYNFPSLKSWKSFKQYIKRFSIICKGIHKIQKNFQKYELKFGKEFWNFFIKLVMCYRTHDSKLLYSIALE